MRDLSFWKDKLRKALAGQWPSDFERLSSTQLCDIELGLAFLLTAAPKSSAMSLWALTTGYPFPAAETATWSDEQRRALGIVRHLLPYYRSHYQWGQALDLYKTVPDVVRGYDITPEGQITARMVSVAADRFEVYQRTLSHAVPYRRESLRWAPAGTYKFPDRRFFSAVTLSDELIGTFPQGHNLGGTSAHPPVDVAWTELAATAQWIDEQSAARGLKLGDYSGRFQRMRLELLSTNDKSLHTAERLTISGLMHVIGMVSSGKSTLMDIVSVWAAQHDLHVTLVVGDVASILNRAQFFCDLGLAAAPILGASNRKRHLNRLHSLLGAGQEGSPLVHRHRGFRWLSTVCLLDGLREGPLPLEIGKEPCSNLHSDSGDQEPNSRTYACSLYGACPPHCAQRDLVAANIWLATPASLIYTRVPAQINPERLRFLELVYRRSDLVIIDEADQVQVQLDTMFSPSQTLMGRSDEAWLSQVQQSVTSQLNLEGRGQLRQAEVDAWCQAHEVAQSATNRIYGLLLRDTRIRRWVESYDYFTDLTLLEAVARELSGLNQQSETQENLQTLARWMQEFQSHLEDPLGERQPHALAALTHQLLAVTSEERRLAALSEWLRAQTKLGMASDAVEELAQKLEFALLVSVLQDRLDFVLRRWRQVEAFLRLESGGALLFQRPPDDYGAVTPTAPMGNVLAFQYLRSNEQDTEAPGQLRFFRCMGVGRWILLNLPTLFAADGIAGPNTLLLSGTSWAGTSPVFHLQVPATGILRAPTEEVAAIERSRFAFKPMADEKTGRHIRISGRKGADRLNALQALTYELARRSRASGDSLLEQERQRLPAGRQRILLLVGSYEEAKTVYRYLVEELRTDWKGQAIYLVPDDNQFDSEWRADSPEKPTLQRGLVHQFAETDAWILIAPLLAVERGHNILNDEQRAALGAAYFLVRPHPRPNDINYAIHSINHWAVAHHADEPWLQTVARDMSWAGVGEAFRAQGFKRWRELIRLPMIYSLLGDTDRDAITWGQLVSIWQVIGRLVRGGSPARVVFCDAAFAPNLLDEDGPNMPSLLLEMRRVLRPYFEDTSQEADRALVQALYGPLYTALSQMQGVPENATL